MCLRWAFVVRERALISQTRCADRGSFINLDIGVVAIDLVEAGHARNH